MKPKTAEKGIFFVTGTTYNDAILSQTVHPKAPNLLEKDA